MCSQSLEVKVALSEMTTLLVDAFYKILTVGNILIVELAIDVYCIYLIYAILLGILFASALRILWEGVLLSLSTVWSEIFFFIEHLIQDCDMLV